MHIEVTDDYSCKENKSVRLTATSGRTIVLSRKLRRTANQTSRKSDCTENIFWFRNVPKENLMKVHKRLGLWFCCFASYSDYSKRRQVSF